MRQERSKKAAPQNRETRKRQPSWPVKGIISIGAFWRNHEPGGIGLEVRSTPESMAELATELEKSVQEYRNAAAEYPADYVETYLGQLEYASQNKSSWNDQTRFLLMVNIAYLEEIGVIKANNFNGMSFVYEG